MHSHPKTVSPNLCNTFSHQNSLVHGEMSSEGVQEAKWVQIDHFGVFASIKNNFLPLGFPFEASSTYLALMIAK